MKKTTLTLLFVVLISTVKSQTIWDGTPITFTKANNADWTLEANQDRITPTLWITRANQQGLFNIAQETSANFLTPSNTEWALGTTSMGIGNLTFDTLRNTLNGEIGNNILNGPMVLHIIDSDIYIDITFTSWTEGNVIGDGPGGGGFSYQRSTGQVLSINSFESVNSRILLEQNPVDMEIRLKNLYAESDYSIFDMHGKKLLYGLIEPTKSIDISILSPGIYLLRLKENKILKFLKR